MAKCTNCGKESPADYCADCEKFREQLERLRAAQKEWRKRGMPGREKPKARRWGHMKVMCERGYAEEQARKAAASALPPGDRE